MPFVRQHNTTQHNTSHHNTTQHNTTQHSPDNDGDESILGLGIAFFAAAPNQLRDGRRMERKIHEADCSEVCLLRVVVDHLCTDVENEFGMFTGGKELF